MPDHKCFIKPLKFDDAKMAEHASARFMFFDFETYVGTVGQLVPNLAVVQYDTGEEFIFPSSAVIGQDVSDELCNFFKKSARISTSSPTVSNHSMGCSF